ncbi:MAG: V-type ATP synthase subunit I [Clostridia bacterium]|nr:V-type ATP synthase subunit I [Clostridia bacterium]
MAKLKMKYLEIIVPVDESKRIFDYLQHRSVIELKKHDETEGLYALNSGRTPAQLEKFCDVANDALGILNKYVPESKGLISSFFSEPEELTEKEFNERAEKADSVLALCYEICELERKAAESLTAAAKHNALRDGLEPWLNLDLPLNFRGTDSSSVFIGTLPSDFSEEALKTALAEKLEDGIPAVEVISHSKERSCIFAACHSSEKDNVFGALRELGFAYAAESESGIPAEKSREFEAATLSCKAEADESRNKIISLAERREDIRFACDYFAMRKEKYESLNLISSTQNVILIEGYVIENKVDNLVKNLEKNFNAAVTVSSTEDDEDAPTAFENKPFAAAVESITAMYSMPGKNDVDPNPVMSIFYYLLFGIMLSDAGYGLLMALGCGFAKFKLKPKGKMKKTVDMYFWCGLATIFWGALFGSWFGDLPNVIATRFLGREPLSVALWFEPVQDPMKLLLFSFLFGIIHLFAGVGISFYQMWKQGSKLGAVCDCIPVYMLIIGICPLAVGIMKPDAAIPPIVKTIGTYLLAAGAILIVLTAGRSSKNIIGKLGLGLYGLYNAASGWLGDILSYSRLLALGLCTGVIATVINTLGTIPENPTVRLILFIPVFIFGHIVNMAINLIGTYVHTNRLQYVEFFGKFYEGGGRSFTPLAANTKFFKFKED